MRNGFVELLTKKSRVVAFWLVPAEPALDFFRATIRRLAREFDAPEFEPHVTLDVTEKSMGGDFLSTVRARPVTLRLKEIACLDTLTKTLFVRCESNRELAALVRTIAPDGAAPYDPHVSLLYKKLPKGEAEKIAQSISLPFSEVKFDVVKTVRCLVPVESRADIEAWETLQSKKLADELRP